MTHAIFSFFISLILDATWGVAGDSKVLGLGNFGFSDEGVRLGSSWLLSSGSDDGGGVLLFEKWSRIRIAEDHWIGSQLALSVSGDDGPGVQGSGHGLEIAGLPAGLATGNHFEFAASG